MKSLNLNKPFEVIVKSPILVGVIMIKDLYDLTIGVFDKLILKESTTMNINYFDLLQSY